MKSEIRKYVSKVGEALESKHALKELQLQTRIQIEDYIQTQLSINPRYLDKKRLNAFEFQVLSQGGEDGIISEIFNRIGTTNKFFVKIGVGNGIENNTANLLFQNWKGVWLEGDGAFVRSISRDLSAYINDNRLTVTQAIMTSENIETIFENHNIASEFDMLSIDIDSYDFWVWKAIEKFSPRVVVIEYNSSWGPTTPWVMDKNLPASFTDHTSCFGASLKSLELLGNDKGYKLVGCNIAGTNAFFVRNDLTHDNFVEPATSENHFEPPRYYLLQPIGHPRNFDIFKVLPQP